MDHQVKFMDDYHEVTVPYLQAIADDPATLIIDDHGYAAGVIWFDDTVDNLRTAMHILIRPEYWRPVIQQDILPQAATKTFEKLGVGKILAFPMSTQKTAIRVLRRYGFYEHKPWLKHTRQNGVKVDVIMFELRRKYWEKRQHERRQPKKSG
jgi:RimJ/RimL family protein N-acetyltransferase